MSSAERRFDGFEPIDEVPPLGIRVHRRLEQQIITRTLPPGARLIEEDLAQSLGVSRGPVRTALHQLALDGFVDLRPRQGSFVHGPTQKEIEDFYDIRRVLEGESARLASLRITPSRAADLRHCLELAESALSRELDPSVEVPKLHGIICAIADNNELARYLTLHRKRSVWYRSPFNVENRRKAWNEHRQIVMAIIRGDAEAAAYHMQHHIDGARSRNQHLHDN